MPITQGENLAANVVPTLLLVDDDDDDHYLLEQAIQTQSMTLRLVHRSSTSGLLTWLGGLDRLPDLILLDFHLPQLSGLDLLVLLKYQPATRSIPVVMWSNFLDDQQQQQCYQAGATRVMLKPDNQPQLTEVIGQLCRQWLPATH